MKNGFRSFLNAISILLIVFSVLCAAAGLVAAFGATGELAQLGTETLMVFIKIYSVLTYVSMALAAVQVVLMLGVFIFNITHLREFGGYFLGAILSLISFGGMYFTAFVMLAKMLQNF